MPVVKFFAGLDLEQIIVIKNASRMPALKVLAVGSINRVCYDTVSKLEKKC